MEKITNENPLSHSEDLVANNIEQLKSLFPEIVTEGKIDFKVLQSILGEEIEEGEEYYRFTWAGKAQARREAHKPSTGTLRPCKEDSVDWDKTQNLYIEGDNLEVLKLLQKSYAGKVKMIYIDPPYNTGNDFVYKDNYKDNLKNYQEVTGQVDSEGNKLTTNSDSDGRFHSNWLNMMYPRLRLARNLLNDDGVIFISIDDNEAHNLKKLCDEIFGESNFVGNICWKKKTNGNNMGEIPPVHDFIFAYSKSKVEELLLGEEIPDSYISKKYQNPDNDVKGPWTTSDLSANHEGPIFPITNPATGKVYLPAKGRYWVFNELEINKRIESGRIIFGKSGTSAPVQKKYLKERGSMRWKVDSWWDNLVYNEEGTAEISELVGTKLFSHPKPSKLIQKLLDISINQGVVLDFFSGSGTTAQSVMSHALESGSSVKYICVQLPEQTNEKSEANKSGYKTIAEIGKERIRRAGKKIAEENPEKAKDLDLGFKVFKLDSSNIRSWDGNLEGKELEAVLTGYIENTKDSETTVDEAGQTIPNPDIRTQEDILYEILLKYGLDLTLPIEEKEIAGKKVFNVGFGALFICLGNDITSVVAEGIGQWKEEVNPEVCRVVFKDNGFTDVEKTNSVQLLKRFGITEIKTL